MTGTTIELSEYVIDAIADAVVKKMQEPKTGHWIADGEMWKCSKCGELSCCQGKFCNDCGARMFEPQESEVRNDR